MKKQMKMVAWIASAFLASTAQAALRLPSVFSNHAVLQAGRPLKVWGWADPGASVSVQVGGHRAVAKAGKDGRFQAQLAALKAGGPYELDVQSGGQRTLATDVMAGEVWLAAGQSNMEMNLSASLDAAEDQPLADDPAFRFFTAEKAEGLEPLGDVGGEWRVMTPQSAGECSAVAYQFGKRLRQQLKRPVGLLISDWGGTQGQLWTPRQDLESVPVFAGQVKEWTGRPGEKKALSSNLWTYDFEFKDMEFIPKDSRAKPRPVTVKAGQDWGGAWGALAKPGSKASFEITPEGAGRFSGFLQPFAWGGVTTPLKPGSLQDLSDYSALRLSVRGKGTFSITLAQPSIKDYDAYRSLTFTPSDTWTVVSLPLSTFKQAGWGKPMPFTPTEIAEISIACSADWPGPQVPSGLYNGMVAPLAGYGLAGFAWYQGEANVSKPQCEEYHELLKAMITGWRSAWGEPNLPFLVVQLPNYIPERESHEGATGDAWACLRASQDAASRELPKVGLVVTLGLGDPTDIHPKQKREVGHRLALAAMSLAYGSKKPFQGPRLKSARREGGTVVLDFNAPDGMTGGTDAPLKGFEVAGADEHFMPAKASLRGTSVLVSAPVNQPVAVRYAWANDPEFSLKSRAGLPAAPFKTKILK